MSTAIELNWRAEIEYDYTGRTQESDDWIILDRKEGAGTQELIVKTKPSMIHNDPDNKGKIIFICDDNFCVGVENPEIIVERCTPDCEYEKEIDHTTYDNISDTAEACDTSKRITLTKTDWYESITPGCSGYGVTGTCDYDVNFDINKTSSANTLTFYYPDESTEGHAVITIIQSPGPCCTCNQINCSKESLEWEWNETDVKTSEIDIASWCSENIELDSVYAIGDFDASLNGNTVSVNPKHENTEEEIKYGAIAINYYVNGESESCESAITLTQLYNGCSCEDLKLSKYYTEIFVGNTDTINVTANCTSITSVRSRNASIASSSYRNGVITISGKSDGDTTIEVHYTAGSNSCTEYINVHVICHTITITPDGATGTGGIVTFTANVQNN